MLIRGDPDPAGCAEDGASSPTITLALLLCVLGVVFIAVPAWELLVNGPFAWHARLPSFSQGGAEAVVLLAALVGAQWLPARAARIGVSILLGECYLRRHAVDAAALIDLVYLELCFGLGAAIIVVCGSPRPAAVAAYLRSFVLGFCVWGVCAWSASAIGLGGTHQLRWLSALLFVPAVASRSVPWSLFVGGRVLAAPPAVRSLAIVIAGWLLVAYAHSATAIGFDSLWYGLRGERVLVGDGSAFRPEALVSAVYYFPKVYELFLIPLSGLGSSTVVAGMSIMLLGLIGAAAYELLGAIGLFSRVPRLLGVGLVVSMPALANTALSPKPDLLAAFLLLLAWLIATGVPPAPLRARILWMLGLLLLAVHAKLTALPYAVALASAFLVALWRGQAFVPMAADDARREARLAGVAFCLAAVLCAFVTSRTLLLAGLPTIGPDPLFKLWLALGFTPRFPVGTLQWHFPARWSDTAYVLGDMLFAPQKLDHIVITWTGNVWLWLAVAVPAVAWIPATARLQRGSDSASFRQGAWPGVGLALMALCLVVGWGFATRGGDGNYFIAGSASAILLGSAALWRRVEQSPILRRSVAVVLAAFCISQAACSFLTAEWNAGTREFDLDFTRGPRTFDRQSRQLFAQYGLARVEAYLRVQPGSPRVVGCTALSNTLGMRLSARFEDLPQITFARGEYTGTAAQFAEYLARSDTRYLLVPHADNHQADCARNRAFADTVARLAAAGNRPLVRDAAYDLFAVSAVSPAAHAGGGALAGSTAWHE